MRSLKLFSLLSFFTILLFLPVILDPTLFLKRGNDLQEFFLPLFHYVKGHLIANHVLPLWNTMFLSGVPLLPDPQSPMFYIPNILFLVFPLELAVIISSILHITVGGLGIYYLLRDEAKFDTTYALLGASFYILSPRLSAFIEAGHWGLIAASAYIPFVVLFSIRILRKPSLTKAIILAVSLSGVFYTHPTTFVLLASGVGFCFVIALIQEVVTQKLSIKRIQFWGLVPLIMFGLVAIALLPQLGWVPETNRFLLSSDRQVWPQWLSFDEFLKSISNPLLFGISFANSLDTEKWIPLGIVPILLSLYGWLKSDSKSKIVSAFAIVIILILALNNVSPFYSFLLSQNWYVYARVSTRSWFVISIITLYFTLFGARLVMKKHKRFALFILSVAVLELTILSWTRITKPYNTRSLATNAVITYLKEDKDTYRIFCTTRCFSQYDVAKYNLETIEGYSTLHQKNYYEHAWQLTGTYWNYYTLALPPIGSYKFGELDPDFASLGEYNTKYVLSPHLLDDPYAKLINRVDGFYIYKNEAYAPRVYYINEGIPSSITYTRPSAHELVLALPDGVTKVTVAEVFSQGWQAYSADNTPITVQQQPNALISLDVPRDVDRVRLVYHPKEYTYGRLITVITIVGLGIWGYISFRRSNKLF